MTYKNWFKRKILSFFLDIPMDYVPMRYADAAFAHLTNGPWETRKYRARMYLAQCRSIPCKDSTPDVLYLYPFHEVLTYLADNQYDMEKAKFLWKDKNMAKHWMEVFRVYKLADGTYSNSNFISNYYLKLAGYIDMGTPGFLEALDDFIMNLNVVAYSVQDADKHVALVQEIEVYKKLQSKLRGES